MKLSTRSAHSIWRLSSRSRASARLSRACSRASSDLAEVAGRERQRRRALSHAAPHRRPLARSRAASSHAFSSRRLARVQRLQKAAVANRSSRSTSAVCDQLSSALRRLSSSRSRRSRVGVSVAVQCAMPVDAVRGSIRRAERPSRRPRLARSSCSRAYSRTVSSSANRGSLPVPSRCVSEALLHERREAVEGRVADGLGRLEREAAGEDREPREQPLLVAIEQAEAPVDRGAERAVAPGASRAPPVRTGSRWSSRSSSFAGGSSFTRAAASSIASGRSSRRAQISATTARSPFRAKSGRTARARSANSSTAAVAAEAAGPGYSCSPASRSGIRLVASTFARGAAASQRLSSGAASTTRSTLSRTRRTCLSRKVVGDRVGRARGRRAPAGRGAARPPAATSSVSATSARSTKKTPSSYSSSTSGGELDREARLARSSRAR